jgi:phosphate transport system substrate-binding protein
MIDRPRNQNIRQSFEEVLGIVQQIPKATKVVHSDQTAMNTVAGNVSAATYTSLAVALDAVKYGMDVNVLMIDHVEAEKETVRDGRYTLRRPVLLLFKKGHPLWWTPFVAFALSEEGRAIVDDMVVAYASLAARIAITSRWKFRKISVGTAKKSSIRKTSMVLVLSVSAARRGDIWNS